MIIGFELAASVATTLGIPFGAYQLYITSATAKAVFEDALVKEYRQHIHELLTNKVDVDDLFPSQNQVSVPPTLLPEAKAVAYKYFDLCNQQAILIRDALKWYRPFGGKISRGTAREWQSGILYNMSLPIFKNYFVEIRRKANNQVFDNLDELLRYAPPTR